MRRIVIRGLNNVESENFPVLMEMGVSMVPLYAIKTRIVPMVAMKWCAVGDLVQHLHPLTDIIRKIY